MLSFNKVSLNDKTDYYQELKNNFGYCKNTRKLINQDSKNKMLANLINKHIIKGRDKSTFGINSKEDISFNKEIYKVEKNWVSKIVEKDKNSNIAKELRLIKGVISWNRSQEDMHTKYETK